MPIGARSCRIGSGRGAPRYRAMSAPALRAALLHSPQGPPCDNRCGRLASAGAQRCCQECTAEDRRAHTAACHAHLALHGSPFQREDCANNCRRWANTPDPYCCEGCPWRHTAACRIGHRERPLRDGPLICAEGCGARTLRRGLGGSPCCRACMEWIHGLRRPDDNPTPTPAQTIEEC